MPKGRGIRLSRRECWLLLMLSAPVILIHLADFAAQLGEATGAGWERDTVMLELFSGEQRLTNMYRSHGHRAQWFDILGRGQSNDLLDPMGFMFALRETMRLSPGALLFAGVPCASWVWISCSTHLRHLSILGDERVDFVLKGNIIAARFALLCLVSIVLKAHHVVEQPSSSKLVFYPYMQFIWQNYGAIFQRFWMCNFDHFSLKPSYLVGTRKWIASMDPRVDPVKKQAIQQKGDNGMVKKTISKESQKKTVSGGPSLKSSAAYTETFAEFIYKNHMASSDPFEVELPQGMMHAPFDWSHAELGSLRNMLVAAQHNGLFTPQPDLPL